MNQVIHHTRSEQLLIDLLVELHGAGLPTNRLEDEAKNLARSLTLKVQVLALPTALTIAVGPADDARVVLRRVEPSDPNLARLEQLDTLCADLADDQLTVCEAHQRLASIRRAPAAWSPWMVLATWFFASGAGAILFRGSLLDTAVSALFGLLIGLLARVLQGRRASRALAMVSALGVSLTARLLVLAGIPIDPGVITVASLMVLLPGYSFTIGMVELGTGHLVAGTARAASAAVSLCMLILGVALGNSLMPAAKLDALQPLPEAYTFAALAIAPIVFGANLGAPARALPLIFVTTAVTLTVAWLGDDWLGPPAGAFLGAFTIGMAGTATSRWLRKPASLVLVPGVLMMVPGSVGFRSLTALLSGDVMAGVDEAFRMALTAAALAAGIVLAPSVWHPHRET